MNAIHPTAEPLKQHMSERHKAALEQGREERRIVRLYLRALDNDRPKRGRRRTPEGIEARLAKIDETIYEVDPIKRLEMAQEHVGLSAELETMNDLDLGELEAEFIECAASYSERKGITRLAWRKVGVPGDVLKEAGL